MEAYLIDKNNSIVSIFKIKEHDLNVTGDIYNVTGWDMENKPCEFEYFANVYVKWDGCSHFRFKGEDFNIETDKLNDGDEADSYYHICGLDNYIDFSMTLYFAYVVMTKVTTDKYSKHNWEAEPRQKDLEKIFELLKYRVEIER